MNERDLYIRVRGEFREMPGLSLTLRQAARLFSLEQGLCERVLRALVKDGVLATDGSRFASPGMRVANLWRDAEAAVTTS